MNIKFDAIVIGSGIGGLATASILAKAKKKVLVLERHYELGGLTHAFNRRGYQWEVGLHYVGKMQAGTLERLLFDYITDGKITWKSMPRFFERFIYPGMIFKVPNDQREYQHRLCKEFPDETKAIRKYFADLRRAAFSVTLNFAAELVPFYLKPLIYLFQRRSLARQTTAAYLDHRFRNEKLKVLVTSQWGDYGLPPSESSFGIHAIIATHYFDGGFFPEEGSSAIGAIIEDIIESAGGAVLTNAQVTRILSRNNRAYGVEVRHSPSGNVKEYHAAKIVSGIGAELTYGELITMPRSTPRLSLLENAPHGYSAVTLYIGFKTSPEELGVNGENLWINRDFDPDDTSAQSEGVISGKPKRAYLSFPSLRSGNSGAHTAQIIAFVKPSLFDRWKNESWNNHSLDYETAKQRISEGLLELAEEQLPGFKALVEYTELSTPLSITHFTGRKSGLMYGVPAGPQRMDKTWFQSKTPVKNLYISGSDVFSLGIIGAMMGGVAAASAIKGWFGFPRILLAASKTRSGLRLPNYTEERDLENQRLTGRVEEWKQVTRSVVMISVRIPKEIKVIPGQFARFLFEPGIWRDYSIMSCKSLSNEGGSMLHFMIDTKFNGQGGKFIKDLRKSDQVKMRLPLGDFSLRNSEREKFFISTGTGITPLLPMLNSLRSRGERHKLVFGCRTEADNLLDSTPEIHEQGLLSSVLCFSRENKREGEDGYFSGRVTSYVKTLGIDFSLYDFYVSGNPAMVEEISWILSSKGAEKIYTEKY